MRAHVSSERLGSDRAKTERVQVFKSSSVCTVPGRSGGGGRVYTDRGLEGTRLPVTRHPFPTLRPSDGKEFLPLSSPGCGGGRGTGRTEGRTLKRTPLSTPKQTLKEPPCLLLGVFQRGGKDHP